MFQKDGISFIVSETISSADLQQIEIGLSESHQQVIPRLEQGLIVLVRTNDNQLIAGLNASTYWQWLNIRHLWVSKLFREQGIGRQIINLAEAEALNRGCHSSFVNTFSFQAQGFYKKLGYEVFGVLEDFPPGHQRLYMKKLLRLSKQS